MLQLKLSLIEPLLCFLEFCFVGSQPLYPSDLLTSFLNATIVKRLPAGKQRRKVLSLQLHLVCIK